MILALGCGQQAGLASLADKTVVADEGLQAAGEATGTGHVALSDHRMAELSGTAASAVDDLPLAGERRPDADTDGDEKVVSCGLG